MRASLFSKLRPSLRSLTTPAAFHRLMQRTPPSHVGRPLARLSCCALHSNTTRLQPRACGLLGGHQRRPSLARRLLSSQSPRDPYTVLDVPRGANQAAIKQGYFRAAKRNHPDVVKRRAPPCASARSPRPTTCSETPGGAAPSTPAASTPAVAGLADLAGSVAVRGLVREVFRTRPCHLAVPVPMPPHPRTPVSQPLAVPVPCRRTPAQPWLPSRLAYQTTSSRR